MIVHKQVKVSVGQGRPTDIIDALRESGVPDKAVATKIKAIDELVISDGNGVLTYVTDNEITFEWDDEE